MNLDIFKSEDPSGKMFKESFLLKNHSNEFHFITDYCDRLGLSELSFKEKVFLCINNMSSIPICKNPNCSSKTKFVNSTIGYKKYCSKRCVSTDPHIKKTKEEKSIQKFGTKIPSESKYIKDKIILTNNLKYGGNSPMSSEEIRSKSRTSILKNHGVDNPSKSKDILKKRVESFRKNIDQYKISFKKTSLEKYGVDHPWKSPEVHKKTIDFFYKSYLERISNKIDNTKYRFLGFDKDGLITNLKFHCFGCKLEFKILTYQFYTRINHGTIICTNCYPISKSSSLGQIDVYNFIRENYKGEVILDYYDHRYEIDIFLPELNIGFEFNGVFWHSSKFKNPNYHEKKFEFFENLGIGLYTIWEDDWQIKRDIVKSFILNKIHRSGKIFARSCEIREVGYLESREFLIENHLQGDCKSSIRLALFKDNVIYSIMTFSRPRISLGSNGNQKEINQYELTRFCNKNYYTVIGGASKLFKFFLNKYSPESVFTYSDNLISSGHLYKKIGFNFYSKSRPGYWYLIDGVREHRFNWRKSKLVSLGYSSDLTEDQIMESLGCYRIYNGGNKKWIYETNLSQDI